MNINAGIIATLTGLVGTAGGVLISYLTLKHNYDQDKHRLKVGLGCNLILNVPGISSNKKQFTKEEIEKQIDQIVYKLYDLTSEEISIIEESFND